MTFTESVTGAAPVCKKQQRAARLAMLHPPLGEVLRGPSFSGWTYPPNRIGYEAFWTAYFSPPNSHRLFSQPGVIRAAL